MVHGAVSGQTASKIAAKKQQIIACYPIGSTGKSAFGECKYIQRRLSRTRYPRPRNLRVVTLRSDVNLQAEDSRGGVAQLELRKPWV
jgi:hypothetical protein